MIFKLNKFFTDVLFHENIFPFKAPLDNSATIVEDPISASIIPHLVPTTQFQDDIIDIHQSSVPSSTPSSHSDPMSSSSLIDNTASNSNPQPSRTNYSPPPRRSTRTKAPPSWLQDYICSMGTNSKPMAQSVNTFEMTAPHSLPTTHKPNPTPCPLFLPIDLVHLSSNYVASPVDVL